MMKIFLACYYLLVTDNYVFGGDHKGKEFILAFCEHINGASVPVLTIINDNDLKATVNISTPKPPKVIPALSLTVRDTKSVRLSSKVIQRHSSLKFLAVWVTSDRPVTLQGITNGRYGSDPSVGAFLAIPVDELGTEHVVVTLCKRNSCIFMIVGTEDQTDMSIKFRIEKGGTVQYTQRTFRSGEVLKQAIGRYYTLQLKSKQDLSGTYIHSSKPVAVFSGADYTTAASNSGKDNIIEQIPHFGWLGTHYVVPFMVDLTKTFSLKVIAVKKDTVVRLLNSKWRVHEFQVQNFSLNPQEIHTLESNYPVMVAIVVKSWGYYNLGPKHNVDVSLSVLHPINRTKAVLNLRQGYRIRGMFPEGEVHIEDIWYMLVTDKNCDVRASSVVKRDPSSHYAVLGFYFPRLKGDVFNLEPPGHCLLYSGIQWMRGVKQGGMLPWAITYIQSRRDNMENRFFCNTSTWVTYIVGKQYKPLDFILDFVLGCKFKRCF